MKVEENTYLYLIKTRHRSHKNDELCADKILDHVQDDLEFKYADVSFQEFKAAQSTKGWFGRKIIALPAAVWSGVVTAIYHLVKAVLVGALLRLGDKEYFKAYVFCAARDLQESFGWLAILLSRDINGQLPGQRHIQESRFHISCYEDFLIKKEKSSNATNKENPESKKLRVMHRVTNNPNSFLKLNANLKNDEDIVAAALNGCTTAKKAKKVFDNADNNVKDSKKVAFALVKIDPCLLELLSSDIKDYEDIVLSAIDHCKDPEQTKKAIKDNEETLFSAIDHSKTPEQLTKIIESLGTAVKENKKIYFKLKELAKKLLTEDPSLFTQLPYSVRNDEDILLLALDQSKTAKQLNEVWDKAGCALIRNEKVVLKLKEVAKKIVTEDSSLLAQLPYIVRKDIELVCLAIEQSTEQTIHKIWSSLEGECVSDPSIRAKIKKKYPNFFKHERYEKFGSSNSQNTPPIRPFQARTPEIWSEPDNLKNNTSEQANTIRTILKQKHLLGIDLTKVEVSSNEARDVLHLLLNLNKNASKEELKKAYKKAALSVHPDKCELKSAEEAFKTINAAYTQSGFK